MLSVRILRRQFAHAYIAPNVLLFTYSPSSLMLTTDYRQSAITHFEAATMKEEYRHSAATS